MKKFQQFLDEQDEPEGEIPVEDQETEELMQQAEEILGKLKEFLEH